MSSLPHSSAPTASTLPWSPTMPQCCAPPSTASVCKGVLLAVLLAWLGGSVFVTSSAPLALFALVAAAILLEHVELAGRLTLDLADLKVAADEREEEIARYLSANDEVGEVVASLERQYDAFAEAEDAGSNLLAEDQPLPTGDEIGQQFEQFLAGLEPDADPDEENPT